MRGKQGSPGAEEAAGHRAGRSDALWGLPGQGLAAEGEEVGDSPASCSLHCGNTIRWMGTECPWHGQGTLKMAFGVTEATGVGPWESAPTAFTQVTLWVCPESRKELTLGGYLTFTFPPPVAYQFSPVLSTDRLAHLAKV